MLLYGSLSYTMLQSYWEEGGKEKKKKQKQRELCIFTAHSLGGIKIPKNCILGLAYKTQQLSPRSI